MDECMNRWTNVYMDEYMDGWMVGPHYKHDPQYKTIMMSGILIVVESKITTVSRRQFAGYHPPLLAYDP